MDDKLCHIYEIQSGRFFSKVKSFKDYKINTKRYQGSAGQNVGGLPGHRIVRGRLNEWNFYEFMCFSCDDWSLIYNYIGHSSNRLFVAY